MRIKFLLSCILLVNVHVACSKPKDLSLEQDTFTCVSEYIRDGLKNFAFCKCLRHSFDANKTLKDSLFWKDGTIGGYLHTREISWHYFDILDTMAIERSKIVYPSKDNDKTLTLMKCLDFYNSSKLDSVVAKILKDSEEDWNSPNHRKHYMFMYETWRRFK